MRKHWRYLVYLLRHKWFVLVAGVKIGAPLWRLIIHDWSKFLPSEWFPYVEYFYGDWTKRAEKLESDTLIYEAFNVAWLKHQHRNAHHWQHWVLRQDSGNIEYLEVPLPTVREMVADWSGAGRAITGKWDVTSWYLKMHLSILLHPQTRKEVESILGCMTEDIRDY